MKTPFRIFSALFFVLLNISTIYSQTPQEELRQKLGEYFSIPKEVAYLHLNKSLLLQGEQLGVGAYIVDKSSLKPSISTTNLYVQIRDSKKKIIKEELLLVEKGVTSGVFDIDSSFVPGDYTITAYTNWMRNFDEQNFFTENIKVLGSNMDSKKDNPDALANIDAQFLPESGHLLKKVLNHVGVIVKDSEGHGLPNAGVVIMDSKKNTIGNFKLNEFGIGRFSFTPVSGENYSAIITLRDKEYALRIKMPIEDEGIILSASQRDNDLRLLISTNEESLAEIRGNSFILALQGRNLLETYSLQFKDHKSIPLLLKLSDLDPGVNILTLFNKDLQPIAERLIFNHHDLPFEEIKRPRITKLKDSLEVSFALAQEEDRTFSVSVLPQNTISYNRNHNIISYNLLQPFLNGSIEDAGWYFEDVTERKKYELDNLLITQGWSSYNWKAIFNSSIATEYKFEKNFEMGVNIHNKKILRRDQRYVIHASSISPVHFFEIPKDNENFIYDSYKPVEGEKLLISRVQKNNELLPAALSIRFSPSKIPDFQPEVNTIPQKFYEIEKAMLITQPAFMEKFTMGADALDEVKINVTVDKEKERERKLDKSAFSRVSLVTEEDLRAYQTLGQYLTSRGLRVSEEGGTMTVTSSAQSGARSGYLTMALDNQRITDTAFFYNYPLYLVDYVDIDKGGLSQRYSGGGGSINVVSDFEGRHRVKNDRTRIQEFDVPLAYSPKKIFYTPKYSNTSDKFFEEYGVIDWKPELRSKSGEKVTFKIKRPEVDYKLLIEGFTSEGTLFQEEYSFPAAENDGAPGN